MSQKNPPIRKDMIIGDIVGLFPEAADILLSYGIHCVGCYANAFETLEQGLLGHGYTEEQLNELVDELNEFAEESFGEEGPTGKLPKEADDMQVTLTDKAIEKIQEVSKAEGKEQQPLRIELFKSADGYKYRMNFIEDQELRELDKRFSFADGKVAVVVDKRDHRAINGLEVDFVQEDERAGFKMNNPNDPRHQLG